MSDSRERVYNNARAYLNFIKDFPRVTMPKTGRFYCFTYAFHVNPYYKEHPEDKKYLDFQPCDLCFANRPAKEIFYCINVHNMPVKSRILLLNKIKKDYEQAFDHRRAFIPGLNYKKLFRYLKKIGVAVRCYRYDRVVIMREIPAEQIDETFRYYANFYYQTNYSAIVNKYNVYRPKGNP